MQLPSGTLLQGGKFRIESTLGQGGYGITYLATNTLMKKRVAIKEFFPKDFCNRRDGDTTITSGTAGSTSLVEALKTKFLKEAANLYDIDCTGIVKVSDFFEENNTAYYVMSYINGESIQSIVKREGPMDEPRAIGYISQVAEALSYIHSRRMTHLDVKPGNIMVRRDDDRAILIDFGISKQYDDNGEATSSTPIGISQGYAPIEQYDAAGARSFSPESDVYSLAATLYYMLTGKAPAPATTRVSSPALALPGTTSQATISAIIAAMQPAREDRLPSVKTFMQLLRSTAAESKPQSQDRKGNAAAHTAATRTATQTTAKTTVKSLIIWRTAWFFLTLPMLFMAIMLQINDEYYRTYGDSSTICIGMTLIGSISLIVARKHIKGFDWLSVLCMICGALIPVSLFCASGSYPSGTDDYGGFIYSYYYKPSVSTIVMLIGSLISVYGASRVGKLQKKDYLILLSGCILMTLATVTAGNDIYVANDGYNNRSIAHEDNFLYLYSAGMLAFGAIYFPITSKAARLHKELRVTIDESTRLE